MRGYDAGSGSEVEPKGDIVSDVAARGGALKRQGETGTCEVAHGQTATLLGDGECLG